MRFERLAIDVLRECDVTGATRILGVSWDEAWGVMERAVDRGKLRKVRRVVRQIGVDETLKGTKYLWHYVYPEAGRRFWKRWYFWATHSRLKPMLDAAGTLKRHLTNILTYFRHRISNAVSEGLNSKIQTIKKMAYGFRNLEHFKTAIYFHCGGVGLYPC